MSRLEQPSLLFYDLDFATSYRILQDALISESLGSIFHPFYIVKPILGSPNSQYNPCIDQSLSSGHGERRSRNDISIKFNGVLKCSPWQMIGFKHHLLSQHPRGFCREIVLPLPSTPTTDLAPPYIYQDQRCKPEGEAVLVNIIRQATSPWRPIC